MTEAEIILWSKIKNKQLNGYKFRRQASIANFIVDFYCPKIKLAVEIDGDLHYLTSETRWYDRRRQNTIENFGVKFLRFSNIDIYKNIDGVIRTIELVAAPKDSLSTPPARQRRATSPHLRGGRKLYKHTTWARSLLTPA